MNLKALLIRRLLFATAAAAAWMLAPTSVIGQDPPVQESFTGFAINMNSGPKTGTVDGLSVHHPGDAVEQGEQGSGQDPRRDAAHIDKSKNLVLENYGQQPVRFNEIHEVK
jgi:hypothetical protein